VLVLGGNGWLQIKVNAAVWAALFDTLRGDLASTLDCSVSNVTISNCAPSNSGLTVSYQVRADTAADANAITEKAQDISTTALHATMLLYQSSVPSGSNVTVGWSSASFDGSFTASLATGNRDTTVLLPMLVASCLVLLLVVTF